MDILILLLVVVGGGLLLVRSLNADTTNSGKVFYLTLLEHIIPGSTLDLYIVTDHPDGTTVRISVPRNISVQTPIEHRVNYAESTKVSLSRKAGLFGHGLSDLGIYLESDQMITVQVVSQYVSNLPQQLYHSVGGYLAFPYSALGTEYVAVTYREQNSCNIGLVATHDNTSVKFVYKSLVTIEGVTYNNGDQTTIIMNKYQTYQMQSQTDLTGTEVVSNYPVAVFVGSDLTTVGGRGNRDYMTEQLPPIDALGNVHVLLQTPLRTEKNLIRVVATKNLTQFNIDGTIHTLTMAGNFKDVISVDTDSVLTSTEPVLVAQICPSPSKANTYSDPNLVIVTPVRQWTGLYTFTTPTTVIFNELYLVLVAGAACTDEIKLDGTVVQDWRGIQNTNFSFIKTKVVSGYHQVDNQESCSQVWGYIYGTALYQSWAMPIGWGFKSYQTLEPRLVSGLDTDSTVYDISASVVEKGSSLDISVVENSSSLEVSVVEKSSSLDASKVKKGSSLDAHIADNESSRNTVISTYRHF